MDEHTAENDALVEQACEVMHDAYEAAAVAEGWETQERSRKPWADVPEANKATMRAAIGALLDWLDTRPVPPASQLARAWDEGWMAAHNATHPDECPPHSTDPMYRSVAGNRRNLGMPPQECICGGASNPYRVIPPGSTASEGTR